MKCKCLKKKANYFKLKRWFFIYSQRSIFFQTPCIKDISFVNVFIFSSFTVYSSFGVD